MLVVWCNQACTGVVLVDCWFASFADPYWQAAYQGVHVSDSTYIAQRCWEGIIDVVWCFLLGCVCNGSLLVIGSGSVDDYDDEDGGDGGI